MKYIVLALMWVGFGVLHSFLISLRFTNWVNRITSQYFAFYRLAYNVFSLVLLALIMFYTKTLDSVLVLKFLPPWTILQEVLLAACGVTMLWAFLSYDPLEFIGIRQVLDLRNRKEFAEHKAITKKGLLGAVRHPMYLATIVAMWSLNSTRADILVHVILTVYILVGIRLEERKLVKQFGSEYTAYQQEVPALVPFTKKAS